MSEIDEKTQRKVLEKNGWIPVEVLGEGGSGRVFKVISSNAANRLVDPLLPSDRDRAVTQANRLAQTIAEIANGSQLVLAAGKVTKEPSFRTTREIRILQETVHPHLIRLIASDPKTEPQWYVMPFMRRGTLANNAALFKGDLRAVVRGVCDIAGALATLHGKGVVHRDVKPGNVFLDENGGWFLGDPGVAYLEDDADATKTRPVSKDWFPRWYDDELGHSSLADVYMVAATATFLITGKKPLDPTYLHPDRLHLPTMFPNARGATQVHELLSNLLVAEPRDIQAKDGEELRKHAMDVLAVLEDDPNEGLRSQIRQMRDEPTLMFAFGRSNGTYDSGDHPGLQMMPVRVPREANALRVWIRFDVRLDGMRYKLTLWNESRDQQLLESPDLNNDKTVEFDVPEMVRGQWCRLSVQGQQGHGTSYISGLIVHGTH